MTPLNHTVILPFVLALLLVGWIHPKLVEVAWAKNIVDNPDARKLQRTPVPILGGVAVFFGAVLGIGCTNVVVDCSQLFVVVMSMMVMLYIGTMDDILNLSPGLRIAAEIATVLLLVFAGGYSLNDFHGLWGVGRIPARLAVPLTVFASVGIINAINLIDGVDGLSSGFCFMACIVFGTLFHLSGDTAMTVLAAVAAGGLLPFFLHNVFGKSSKMFIGDGGTLVMGLILSIFVLRTLQAGSLPSRYVGNGMGLVAFTLAVLSVPVFDTLRVMSARLLRGVSPFHPDKTHLHHLFIDLGFSHAGTTVSILTLDLLVVLCWWGLYAAGLSIDGQLYAVLLLNVLITFGLYRRVRCLRPGSRFRRMLRRLGAYTHIERQGVFLGLQRLVDKC